VGQVNQKSSTISPRLEFGREGEDLASAWLIRHGFTILCRNWRYHRYEVDIIAGRGDILHIIEVKTRRSLVYGQPEEGVSRKKIENMMHGAAGWLCRRPAYRRVQYDVLAITMGKKQSPEIVLFEDIYL
jgi:putative endonuclease